MPEHSRKSALEICRVVSFTLWPPFPLPRPQDICVVLISVRGPRSTGRINSMKNSNDLLGNRTHDLPACSAVPQPTAIVII